MTLTHPLPCFSYPHIPRPKTRQRRLLLPNLYHLRPSHHVFSVSLSRKHHPVPRDDRDLHRIFPCLLIFSDLFHQVFLGRASTRRGSRGEEIPQSWIGFLSGWNMDLYRRLHLVEVDAEALRSGIL